MSAEAPKEATKSEIKAEPKDPLEGKTLEMILNELVADYGWEELGAMIRVKCFNENPSIKSSLTFLRRTPWARSKVERLYLRTFRRKKKGKPL